MTAVIPVPPALSAVDPSIGTLFTARIVPLTRVGDTPAVVPEITGRAWPECRRPVR